MLKHSDITAFEDRRLDIDVAAKMGAFMENGVFKFDYLSSGALSYRKVRTLDKRWWIEPKGAELHLWQIDGLRELLSFPRPAAPLVITEGEFDAIAVAQSTSHFVVSVPNGANGRRSEGEIHPVEDQGFRWLWTKDGRLLPELAQFDRFILAVDNDEAGEILRDELAVRLGDTRCWFVEYPAGCKDANDVLVKYGAETLAKVLQGAKPMCPGHLVAPDDLPPRNPESAYSTGWPFLDKHAMLVRPELFVITGAPGHGKSQWMRALTFHLAERHGWKIAYLTPEDPPHRLRRDMNRFALRNQFAGNDIPDWVNERLRICVIPEDEMLTIHSVMREMEAAALHHDCQVFVLDPWNEIFHDYGRLNETQYIERTLMILKRKARRLNLVLFIVAHPRKLDDGQKASLWTISGSAAWRNKCDHGVIIHRPAPDAKIVDVIVEKVKDHETMGEPGKLLMRFRPAACDYELYEEEGLPG